MPVVIPRGSIVLGRRFQRRLLSELPQQMEQSTESLRARASWCVILCASCQGLIRAGLRSRCGLCSCDSAQGVADPDPRS